MIRYSILRGLRWTAVLLFLDRELIRVDHLYTFLCVCVFKFVSFYFSHSGTQSDGPKLGSEVDT